MAETATRAESPAKGAQTNSERHAFVVDDEDQFRSVVATAMSRAGYTAHEFVTIPEIEAALTQWRPAIIVLDLSLGESDAIEVMRSLATARFAGKILLVSGHDPATLEEVRKIGEGRGLSMMQPLHKPFRIEEMRKRLSSVGEPVPPVDGEADLDAALRNNWLELWYQPKIDLKSMQICGAEALIRLKHPTLGMLPPSRFLPSPGDELYTPLTDFVVRRSLSDWSRFAAWPIGGKGSKMRLAINVPVSVLQSPGFIANLRRHLPNHPDFPGLIVEITEDEAISQPQLAREIANQLRLYNVRVSIDDFGTGHSTLARVGELPFAELKLDRSFVNGCAEDEEKRSTCKSVVEMAHENRMVAVAEGVETVADLDELTGMGYDIAQGFHFAKPMTSTDFAETLAFVDPDEEEDKS